MTSLENTEVRQSSASLRVWVTNTVLFSGDAIFWADMYIYMYFCIGYATFRAIMEFFLKVMPSMAGLQTIFQVNGRIETENCYGATKSNIFLTQYSLVNQTNNIYSVTCFCLDCEEVLKLVRGYSCIVLPYVANIMWKCFGLCSQTKFKDAFNFIRWFPFVCIKMVLLSSCFTFSFIGGS